MKIKNEENNINNGSTWSSTPTINFEKEGVGVDDHIDPLNKNGITLIALIITIIIMLILAGVVISLTLGENGLFTIAKYAVVKTEEEKAREKLELAIAYLQAKKYADIENYDENDYIKDYLSKEGMIVIEDIVIVDGWKFSIDRSIPKIGESLGKGEESKKIEITPNVENAVDYTSATITIEIDYEGTLKEIKINGQAQEIPEKNEEGKYVISKDVATNGKYTIYVKDENDEYKTSIAEVTEISQDLEIKNADDLVYFRDTVNKGATYQGRTIKLLNDIDLSSVCGANIDGNEISWIPIGGIFKGTFDGQNNMIENIYINIKKGNNALFKQNNGTIQNLKISGKITTTSSYGNETAGVVINNRGIIKRCENGVTIISSGPTGGIVSINNGTIEECVNKVAIYSANGNVGGIAGISKGIIKECYNTGNISTSDCCGGIVGTGANINYNCYNTGKVSGKNAVGGITGVVNGAYKTEGIKYTYNSYNVGNITGSSYVGQITGRDNYECTSKSVNCYNSNITASKLNSGTFSNNVWIDDGKKIDKDGNVVDNLNEDKSIKYINNGYPILRWQVQE